MPVGVELAAHLGRALLGDRGRGDLVGLLRLLGADLGQHLLAALRARLDQEAVLAVEQLGQREVEPGLRLAARCPSRRRSRCCPPSSS